MQLISNQTTRRFEFYQTGLNYDGRVKRRRTTAPLHSSHFTIADLNLTEKKRKKKKKKTC